MMLTRSERVVLDTLIPSDAHPDLTLGLLDAGFEDFYNELAASTPLAMRVGLRATLFVAIWLAPLLIGKVPPITLYDRETREQALQAMASSRSNLLRQMIFLMKMNAGFCYGANAEVRDAVGFPLQFDDPRSPDSESGNRS